MIALIMVNVLMERAFVMLVTLAKTAVFLTSVQTGAAGMAGALWLSVSVMLRIRVMIVVGQLRAIIFVQEEGNV